ncbi:putative defense protein 1 isoform X2 [Asterias rubens]|uniref:putative defense protein 1 isoform X2 n=1 Tax=Asterias rubens TaxID=7604 RepID=UPI001454FD08|nr:putative defense protein 1 isoform X2 [Asterias rubens]
MRTAMLSMLIFVPALVFGYGAGPPVSTFPDLCTDMIPVGHNGGVSTANDTDTPPYTITTNSDKYTAGGSLTVTISARSEPTFFEGFFIQARRTDMDLGDTNVSIGEFAYPPLKTQLIQCHNVSNSAWAHSDDPHWKTVSAVWNAPAQNEGPIEFKATIVTGEPSENWFYLDVKSAQISFMAGDAVTVSPPTTQPGVTGDNTPYPEPTTTDGGCSLSASAILSVITMLCGLALA